MKPIDFAQSTIWLGVLAGKTQPPVFLAAEKVFKEPSLWERFKVWLSDFRDDIAGMVKSIISMWQEPDNRKHFIAGFIISLVVGIFNPILGIFAGNVAAFIKEWWDSKGHGTVELYDIIFSIFGALSGLSFALFINHIIF